MGTATMQETDDITEQPQKPEPVQLRTRRDFSLTVTALEERKESVSKLAKKAREEGYVQEARVMEADAAAIDTYILPQFREQREIPLVSGEHVRAAVKNALHRLLHRFAVESDQASRNSGTQHAATMERWQGKRESDLTDKIAICVERYVVEVAGTAYAAGYAAREMTPESIAMRATGPLFDAADSL